LRISSTEGGGPAGARPWFAFDPIRSGTLLIIALLVALGFLLIIGPMVQDGPPGDYETRRGDILLSDGAYEAAIAQFDRALSRSPGHRGAIMGRAIALMESGQPDTAEAEFGRLIGILASSLEPADRTGMGALAAAYANRGILRDRGGRAAEALDDYRRALQTDAGAVEGPGLIDRVLYGTPQASTVAKRASYLEAQLALPAEQRRITLPGRDAQERMHKP
jgi:tetratricopeptide (TPR) repeat protein